MKLYIRPAYNANGRLMSIALCKTNEQILVDEQVVEHFPRDTGGVHIKEWADEYLGCKDVEWGKPINAS